MSEDFYSNNWVNENGPHPQFRILKKHIDRAVQDLFLKALRSRPRELSFVFKDEDQIDYFSQRMIKYWETYEHYEVCSEIQRLSKKFKEDWKSNLSDENYKPSNLSEIFKA